ncbi:MAG: signal recognition particle-docking protein FtsY [Candidatus Berkiellales bacterium]
MLKFFRGKKDNGNSPKDPPKDPSNTQDKSSITNPDPAPATTSWYARLKNSLTRTRSNFSEGLATLFLGKKAIDQELLDNIETLLLTADVGVDATKYIIQTLTQGISRKELNDPASVYQALQQALTQMLLPCEKPLTLAPNTSPFVILMIGVNGAGKTTTIGKLAKIYQTAGKRVLLAAGDTFRAAAIEQLQIWGDRNQIPVTSQHTGADSASVIFDAFQSAKAKAIDILIADTAGRLHTRENLMDELKKVKKVIQKLDPNAPHEIMLVLDATTGQNALLQAQTFHEALGVTGITLTKLDGTAKGGIIFAIANKLQLPIRYIGVGEKLDDLRPFVAKDFVHALFDTSSEKSEQK